MRRSKEHCACVPAQHAIHFLHGSSSKLAFITPPASKSNQTGSQDKQWPFLSVPESAEYFQRAKTCTDTQQSGTVRNSASTPRW